MEPPNEAMAFDRIDTSNVTDALGSKVVVLQWGALLNYTNLHAALLLYSMNWGSKELKVFSDNSLLHKIVDRHM